MKTKFVLLSVLALTCLTGQVSIQDRFRPTSFTYKGTPGSSAIIATRTVNVIAVVVTNNNSSGITFQFRDRSTDCGGAACPIFPDDVPMAAKTVTSFNFPYVEATAGISWSCSVSSGVIVRVIGTY